MFVLKIRIELAMVSATAHNMGRRVSLHLLRKAQGEGVAAPFVAMAIRADLKRT